MLRINRWLAVKLLLGATALPSFGGPQPHVKEMLPFSREFRIALRAAGDACLNAKQEDDLSSAIEALQKFKIETIASERSEEAAEVDEAIQFILHWQDLLVCRERGVAASSRPLQMRLPNLPIGHLMIPRSKILVLLTPEDIGKARHDAPPYSSGKPSQFSLGDGGLRLEWTENKTEDVHYIVAENKTRGTSTVVAELPPGTTECYVPPPDVVPVVSAEVDAVATEAAQACQQAQSAAEVDGIIEKLASFWRRKRRFDQSARHRHGCDGGFYSADLIALASFTQIDCALQFVCNWQDALAERDAGHTAEAKNILLRLSEPKMIFPVLERDTIIDLKDRL
jgi:hypothetical protein